MVLTKINQDTRNRRDCWWGVVPTRPLDAISRRQSGSIQGSYGMLSCQNKPHVGQTSKLLSSICSPGTSVVWRRPCLSTLSQQHICYSVGARGLLRTSRALVGHPSDCSVVLRARCWFSEEKTLWNSTLTSYTIIIELFSIDLMDQWKLKAIMRERAVTVRN